ncbi:MAG: magnesium transporter CorA [Clostridiales bacterium]|nr:magnesium transporter CorA [Clostridiales bacterium]MBS5877249.1 magnesium transporter CorA [Clostridiales bacterium]MDU3490601.1 CorA family divalent cation transporter [Clostridiales bacterium]
MYYKIDVFLEECSKEDLRNDDKQYVAILTSEEWKNQRESFNMGIDLDTTTMEILSSQAEVNYDSLTGTFVIPNRKDLSDETRKFAFALDEKGIVLIDDTGYVNDVVSIFKRTKKWRFPSLERFIYDFLDQIIKLDPRLLENYENELDKTERAIIDNTLAEDSTRVNEIRGDLRDLRKHYGQLMEVVEIFEENENSFFKIDNLRYFRIILNKIDRLRDSSNSLNDYTIQIRDLQKTYMDIKQNRIMTILTVVTTIFMPLTLIAGWYGMNFKYMPELDSVWGYPVIIGVSLFVAVGSLIFFKKKKWL